MAVIMLQFQVGMVNFNINIINLKYEKIGRIHKRKL